MDDDSFLGELGSAAGNVVGAVGRELKKMGQVASSQVTGKPVGDMPNVSSRDLSKLNKADKEFSKQSQAEIKANINRIYQEYTARKNKEEQMAKQREEEQGSKEKAKKQQVVQLKKQEEINNPAINKTRAEIKNYGAE